MPAQEIKSIWERSAKCSDLSLSITLHFIFSSITKARVTCIQCLNVCFTLKWGEGSLFLRPPHLTVKAGFVIPSLYAGSGIKMSLLCPSSPDLPKSGISGTDRVQREGWGVDLSRTTWHTGSRVRIVIALSQLMCWVLCVRCSAQGAQFVGLMSPGMAFCPRFHGDLSGMIK